MWADAEAGREIGIEARADVRLAACHATEAAIAAVDACYRLGSGASLSAGGRLDRCFRDAHAAGQHLAVSPVANLEPIGRVLFGLAPGVSRF
jgi:3-hydroxy-9,10-secoandrosta-1,3,5(10)-triene-9,17-dione monooxygenase